MGYCSGEL
jgi:hypothetical protein